MISCVILKQASNAVPLLCSPTDLLCSILYCQQWRSYARRELRGGERLFVLNIGGVPSICLERKCLYFKQPGGNESSHKWLRKYLLLGWPACWLCRLQAVMNTGVPIPELM